jgi:hypothetical protein
VGGPGPGAADGEAPDADDGSTDLADEGVCGAAGTLITTMNPGCLPCIESQGGCCMVDQACSNSDCYNLLLCSEACAAGDLTCVANCETQYPDGVTKYNDFAQCITNNCVQCPAPQQTTVPRDR